MKSKIVFVHPAIRPYRAHIYSKLQDEFNAKFYLIGFEAVNLYWSNFFQIRNCEILKEYHGLGYKSGVSLTLLKRALTQDYDVWIGSTLYGFTSHFAYPIVKARKKKFVLWSEDWYWGGDLPSQIAKPVCKLILKGADLLIVAGTKHKEFVCQNGTAEAKVKIAHNSYIPLQNKTIGNLDVAEFLRQKKRFRVLYLGRLLEYKGLDILIEAYSEIEKRHPDNTELLIAGSGKIEQKCRALVRKLDLRNVFFLGRVDPEEAYKFYRHTDIFVHPCRWCPKKRIRGESWGFVVNEAMSMGVPVVTTSAVGSAYDLIEHGKSGFIIRPNNSASLTQMLEMLYTDASLRSAVGQAAKMRIQSKFMPASQAMAFVEAIKTLL